MNKLSLYVREHKKIVIIIAVLCVGLFFAYAYIPYWKTQGMNISTGYNPKDAERVSRYIWAQQHPDTDEPWDGDLGVVAEVCNIKMEVNTRNRTRLVYDFDIKEGGCEIKLTTDTLGENIIYEAVATKEANKGIYEFGDEYPCVYYWEKPISEDSEYTSNSTFQWRFTKMEEWTMTDEEWRALY